MPRHDVGYANYSRRFVHSKAESNKLVIQTRTNGEFFLYQAGRYPDIVVRAPFGWRYQQRRVIFSYVSRDYIARDIYLRTWP